jgi:hypothetical protein
MDFFIGPDFDHWRRHARLLPSGAPRITRRSDRGFAIRIAAAIWR